MATNNEDLENGTNDRASKSLLPLVAAVVIISLLHIQVVKGWGLNLSLLMLVGSELSLMLRQRQNGKDADLVEALMKGPPKRTRDEALLACASPKDSSGGTCELDHASTR